MNLATWNLEGGGRTAAAREGQKLALDRLCADVMVFTEPGPRYLPGEGCVTSPMERPSGALRPGSRSSARA